MWLAFNDGFISAVQDRDNSPGLVVRSRRPEILQRLFPKSALIVDQGSDYKYRVFVDKSALAVILVERITDIDYDNFKNSVEDPALYDLYSNFWYEHKQYQR